MSRVFVIGGAVGDLSLVGVDEGIFQRHSTPLERMPLSPGGDAMNEACVLARLGTPVWLCTLLGRDAIGGWLMEECRQRGIHTEYITQDSETSTSLNVVLVDRSGQRTFVTAKNTSLRLLGPEHTEALLNALEPGDLVSFASIFVSPRFGLKEMEELFRRIHEKGCILCADLTRAKQGERVKELAPLLPYVDYLLPNQQEGSVLTGEGEPEAIAKAFLTHGAKNVVLKLGERGCLWARGDACSRFAAYPKAKVLDTTGAGDTFAGGFLHCLSKGMETAECLRFANAAASICVEQPGCGSERLEPEEIQKRL